MVWFLLEADEMKVWWYRLVNGEWVFNHRDLNCMRWAKAPVPISEYQSKRWSGAQWKKEYIYG